MPPSVGVCRRTEWTPTGIPTQNLGVAAPSHRQRQARVWPILARHASGPTSTIAANQDKGRAIDRRAGGVGAQRAGARANAVRSGNVASHRLYETC